MIPTLNEELQYKLHERGDTPFEVVDPSTSKVYVLITRDQYDRLKPLFEDDPTKREEQRTLLRRAGERAGWDDPDMDAYDNYDELSPS